MIRFLQTPGPVKKIVLSGILLVFCGAMVITLIPGGLGSDFLGGRPGQGVVATVAGEPVSVNEVQDQARILLQQQFPRGSAQASMLLPFFASRAAEQLISRKALVAEAQRLGFRVSDEEVRDDLQNGRYSQTFFPGGKFIGQAQYEELLRQNNLTPARFEETVRDELLMRKLQALISGSASVSDSDIKQEFERQNTKVKFEYAVLTQQDLQKGLHPTDQELKAFYERNKASYNNSIPEKRKARYVVVDLDKISAKTQVTREELQAYYDQHRDEYRVPEEVKVSHILIKTPAPGADGKVDDKAVEAARVKAEDVLKQVRSGGDFAKLAEKYSDDPGSAKSGGSLGFIGRGRTVPEFEKAAFSLPKGQVSDLVKSSFGFHIIRVEDKHEPHMKTLDEVKEQLEPVIKQQKAQRAAENEANTLVKQARADGLDKAAAAQGMAVVTTDFFSRDESVPGVGNAPQFMEAVFNAKEKAPPDVVAFTNGLAVYEVLGIHPPATPTFEEIRSRVETEFKNERSGVLLTQKTQELSDRAKTSHDLKKAAKELGATVKTSEFVLPDGQVPDIGSMSGPASVAFGMKQGEISGPINLGSSGVVLAILQKEEPTDADYAAKKDQVRDSLVQNRQNELFGLFISNLRQQMEKAGKIKINEQEMKALTRSAGEQGM
ncbi:MAG TPA: peptidyl-prolyl cis-trans isomerase [Terriglobales bacterium]|jgi:peptidyl-prolyl cis-trans isomerase D|nr:peptidyl-prolyl cis-trans isomerase [Terriglobales bacterium]